MKVHGVKYKCIFSTKYGPKVVVLPYKGMISKHGIMVTMDRMSRYAQVAFSNGLWQS